MLGRLRRIVYHPVDARVLYDLFMALVAAGLVYGLFLPVESYSVHPSIMFLYPGLVVGFNYVFGIYTKHRMSEPWVKSVYLGAAALGGALVLTVLRMPGLPLVGAAAMSSLLTIVPRWFFNMSQYAHRYPLAKAMVSERNPILVVGGAGYIGNHVVRQLVENGISVRILDRFYYGKQQVRDILDHPRVEVFEGDVSDVFVLSQALQQVRGVVHLAGIVGDPACALDEQMTRHVNISTTRMLKETVKALGIPRFVFASSCSVYGAKDEVSTENSALNPVSLYAQTKIDSEKELLQDTYDVFHPTILRFATVFGHSERMRFDLVINLFAAKAYHEGLITVFGGSQWRPFIHVADVAGSIVASLEAPLEKVSRQVFNVGDDQLNATIHQIAETVQEMIPETKSGERVRVAEQQGIDDPRNYRVDFGKVSRVLGFKALHGFEDGIREIHEHMQAGYYGKPYTDQVFSNYEITKLMLEEFYSQEYREQHITFMHAQATF